MLFNYRYPFLNQDVWVTWLTPYVVSLIRRIKNGEQKNEN